MFELLSRRLIPRRLRVLRQRWSPQWRESINVLSIGNKVRNAGERVHGQIVFDSSSSARIDAAVTTLQTEVFSHWIEAQTDVLHRQRDHEGQRQSALEQKTNKTHNNKCCE